MAVQIVRPLFCIVAQQIRNNMKKLFVFALSILFSGVAVAQSPVKLGIKGGLNIANLNINNNGSAVNTDSRLAPHIGLLAHIHLSDQIGLQPELVYSGQGTELNFGGGNNTKQNLEYINIPLMLQYMFDNGFRIEAGPQLGFLTSAKLKTGSTTDNNTDDYKKTDVGLGFGLSYLSYSGLGIGGRYNLGLNNINDFGTNEVKNRVAQISLFYLFDDNHKRKSR